MSDFCRKPIGWVKGLRILERSVHIYTVSVEGRNVVGIVLDSEFCNGVEVRKVNSHLDCQDSMKGPDIQLG